jgi:hypothetical protein
MHRDAAPAVVWIGLATRVSAADNDCADAVKEAIAVHVIRAGSVVPLLFVAGFDAFLSGTLSAARAEPAFDV